MTDAAAAVREVYAVNIYSGEKITDYGSYSDVKLLNESGDVKVDADTITFENKADRAYLQGTMEHCGIFWTVKN